MNKRTLLSLFAIAIFPIIVGFFIGGRTSNQRAAATSPSPTAGDVPKQADAIVRAPDGPAVRIEQHKPKLIRFQSSINSVAATGAIQVSANAILAIVNEVPISLQNLLPIGTPNSDSLNLSPERLDFLLGRAINRELIFQAAQVKGVELSQEQQTQLVRVRQTLLEKEGDTSAINLNLTATLDGEIQFEVRDATSQQLLTSLLSTERVGAPQITEQTVRDYYQDHPMQFPALPEASNDERENAWQRIDFEIRQELALKSLAEYQRSRDAFMERLKAEAKITMLVASQ